VELAEKCAFFNWKWLKNMPEVAEKRAFFRWKCLKNVCFSGGSGSGGSG
jgi:hypothetical protein